MLFRSNLFKSRPEVLAKAMSSIWLLSANIWEKVPIRLDEVDGRNLPKILVEFITGTLNGMFYLCRQCCCELFIHRTN